MAQGIPVGRVFAIAWAAAAALAVLGAICASMSPIGQGTATASVAALAFRALPAVILGGLDSVVGALVGGLAVGLAEVFAGTYLAECHRVLADDGLLILSTHGIWRYHPDPLDLWRWTSEGLKRVTQGAGFSILYFRGILGPAATGLQLWQDATLGRVPALLRTPFTWVMQGRIRAADRNCQPRSRDADASVYVIVAKKSRSV